MSGATSNNLYYEPSGFTHIQNGNISWSFANDTAISASALIFNAANSFSSVQGQGQWAYQYYNGSSWNNITSYDSSNQRWGNGSYISRFNLLPDSCSSCTIARAWTAPNAGTISGRGRVLKNDVSGGNGVQARITLNGNQAWPTSGGAQTIGATDQTGFATDVTNLAVASGDVLRFEVTNGGNGDATADATSWAPSVGYTSSSSGGPAGYTFCANENATCSFSGAASVAYGANGDFNYGTYTNSVACTNAVFGDPIQGRVKNCYYQLGSGSGSTNLALGHSSSSSSNWDSAQTADKAFDGSYATNWQSANGQGFAGQWLQVDFGASVTMDKVVLSEYGNRTQGFQIQCWNGTAWQTVYSGSTIGAQGQHVPFTFNAATCSSARLYFTAGSNTPVIYEFEVYNA